jgi:hypothetical protein
MSRLQDEYAKIGTSSGMKRRRFQEMARTRWMEQLPNAVTEFIESLKKPPIEPGEESDVLAKAQAKVKVEPKEEATVHKSERAGPPPQYMFPVNDVESTLQQGLQLPKSRELEGLANTIRDIARIYPQNQAREYLLKAAQLARQNAPAKDYTQEIRDHIEDMRDIIVDFTVRRGMLPAPPAASSAASSAGPASSPASSSSDDLKAWLQYELKRYVKNTPGIAKDHRNATGLWIPSQLPSRLSEWFGTIARAVYRREGATSDEDKERLSQEVYKQYLAFAIEQLHFFDQQYKALDYRDPEIGIKRMHKRNGFVRRIPGAVKTFANSLAQKKKE